MAISPAIFPDGQYDYASPFWQNANDREMYDRSFGQSKPEEQKQLVGLITANPTTPKTEIREQMTASPAMKWGIAAEVPTVDDVLSGNYSSWEAQQDNMSDFSGTPAGILPSDRPSIPYWS